METLVIGIDGGDLKVFQHFEMPFLHHLIENNKSLSLHEDLMSRGWVEIISGCHARDTKAFYMMPKCDGTHDFTLNYSFDDLKENFNGDLLWDIPQKYREKVGIMNVPTTYPAPEVDGFFVSGAGGGLTKVDGIPTAMCSSQEVKDFLEGIQYILDIRFKPSGIEDTDKLFDDLENMMAKRTDAFTDLSLSHEIDFGFLVYRAPVVLLYLAMYEIVDGESSSHIKVRLSSFFSKLDKNLEKIFNKLEPKNFILTADHGIDAQREHVNYNVILERLGYQRTSSTCTERGKSYIKRLLIPALNVFGGLYIDNKYGKVDQNTTEVFGHWYFNGLYINDTKRFGGPVELDRAKALVEEVCLELNNQKEFITNGWKANPYREQYQGSKFSAFLPDIWIEAPDHMFFFGQGRKLIQKNPWYKKIKTLKNIPTSMFTGTKGRHPICIVNEKLATLVASDDRLDLTIVYKLISRLYQSKNL